MGQLTWVYWFLWAVDMLKRSFEMSTAFVMGVDEAAYTIWATFVLLRIIEHYIPRMASVQTLESANPGASDALVRLSSMGALVLGSAGVLQSFGLTAGAIGLASVGGLAFSLASRSLVENLMGGIFLIIRQPFRVGENVIIKDVKGKVARIGWLTTEASQFTSLHLNRHSNPLVFLTHI